MGDRRSLYASAFVRSVPTGMIGVLLGVYLAELKLDASTIAVLIGVGWFSNRRCCRERRPIASARTRSRDTTCCKTSGMHSAHCRRARTKEIYPLFAARGEAIGLL
jgi:hypothetical protein